ncbi:MAG: helix-turn-helix domain-containing protein [Pikeienuella sp.]
MFNVKLGADCVRAQSTGDLMHDSSVHTAHNANLFYKRQANKPRWCKMAKQSKLTAMNPEKPRPYMDIAMRLKWHREKIQGMTQADYAESINVKRPAYSLWEAGSHRLSLDGALSLRKKYGLSMDFMYEGIDDALPMTLRNAWRERP